MRLFIDNQEVEAAPGMTVLEAAQSAGIDIPNLCHVRGQAPCTSCMVCLVKIDGRLTPSCATPAAEGLHVESRTEEVHSARRAALELLLSDHLGDCLAPCQCACPAGMDIPLMLRQIAAGQAEAAIATVRRRIALPTVLGWICPAPCEKACRRGRLDAPVAICRMKLYAAQAGGMNTTRGGSPEPPRRGGSGDPPRVEVAIVGAGPAGLSAAYNLAALGIAATIFDDHDAPGGALRYAVPEERLPRQALEADLATVTATGASFRLNTRVGRDISIEQLRRNFGAVFLAVGHLTDQSAAELGLPEIKPGFHVDRHSGATPIPGVFAGGDMVHRQRLTVRAVADGRSAASAIAQYLQGKPVVGEHRPFTTHLGHLEGEQLQQFLAGASKSPRLSLGSTGVPPVSTHAKATGETPVLPAWQARQEALRCLHCDCRRKDDCRLRKYSARCGAAPAKFRGHHRPFARDDSHPEVIFESGKCISCGLCVRITAQAGEELGLTFIRRGFQTQVAVPFDQPLSAGLTRCAAVCVAACPTGALAFKDADRG